METITGIIATAPVSRINPIGQQVTTFILVSEQCYIPCRVLGSAAVYKEGATVTLNGEYKKSRCTKTGTPTTITEFYSF